MRCPACGYLDSKVVDSRPTEDASSVRRRRECLGCHHRFTTYERLGDSPLLVVKSDGSTEVYDRSKLSRGLLIACAKRPVTPEQIKDLIDDMEVTLRDSFATQVSSKELGNMALERLSGLDDVASIRFASVYKDFKTVEEFTEALKDLK